MSKKKTKKNSKSIKSQNSIGKTTNFTKLLIDYTKRYIKNDGSELDLVFISQLERLQRQLINEK